jgi:hypothetical protein
VDRACWRARAGVHCQAVQTSLVEQPHDLGQVQAGEIRVKKQTDIIWMALAIAVKIRLWLAGGVGEQRDMTLIRHLIERVRRCARHCPLLFCPTGLSSYVWAIHEILREPVHTDSPGAAPVARLHWAGGQALRLTAICRGGAAYR